MSSSDDSDYSQYSDDSDDSNLAGQELSPFKSSNASIEADVEAEDGSYNQDPLHQSNTEEDGADASRLDWIKDDNSTNHSIYQRIEQEIEKQSTRFRDLEVRMLEFYRKLEEEQLQLHQNIEKMRQDIKLSSAIYKKPGESKTTGFNEEATKKKPTAKMQFLSHRRNLLADVAREIEGALRQPKVLQEIQNGVKPPQTIRKVPTCMARNGIKSRTFAKYGNDKWSYLRTFVEHVTEEEAAEAGLAKGLLAHLKLLRHEINDWYDEYTGDNIAAAMVAWQKEKNERAERDAGSTAGLTTSTECGGSIDMDHLDPGHSISFDDYEELYFFAYEASLAERLEATKKFLDSHCSIPA